MGDFILQRLKAFAAVVTPLIVAALIKGAESSFGFTIPPEWALTITAAITGIVVHQTPNKPKP